MALQGSGQQAGVGGSSGRVSSIPPSHQAGRPAIPVIPTLLTLYAVDARPCKTLLDSAGPRLTGTGLQCQGAARTSPLRQSHREQQGSPTGGSRSSGEVA